MMEGFTHVGQEEYIWAMRTSAFREDSAAAMFKNNRTGAQFTTETERKSKLDEDTDNRKDEKHTKVLASLVPDEVINNVNDYTPRKYDSCFLFGDVSGFTELCEKYTKTGVSGPSRMTQVLNKYLGSMVQEILSHSGDILKFSGDAFLAVFKTSETESMKDMVHQAMDCALVIQKNYGSYLTDVGVVIRVKLAISAGLVTFALIGNKTSSHYVVVGQPIWDVKAGEHISSAGDIIVAPAAWKYVTVTEYVFHEMPDNIHIKLVGVGPNWRSVQRSVRQQRNELVEETVSVATTASSDSDALSDISQEGVMDQFYLRPAVNSAYRLGIKDDLRKFIIAPVMKSIDMDEPFEYLTEMRQATIVFINVVSFELQNEKTVILANQSYKAVCRIVDKEKGCVNKVSLFDKDLMFVVIFGLRGLKHELECQAALRCATECHTAINKLSGVLSTSIGVTTGKTYCGVFGHSLRREYTVIGLVVNKAARLMVAYQGKVTCDRDTFLHSKLESKHFILQEYKPLKGISRPGPVYEFIEIDTDHDDAEKIKTSPLLGRTQKLKLYHDMLNAWRSGTNDKGHKHKMLLIKGEARQGKTRLLDELIYTTPEKLKVNKITLTKKDHPVPYQAIRLIFNLPLLLTFESSVQEKEETLLKTLHHLQIQDTLCVLNDVFGVNFDKSKMYVSLSKDQKILALGKVIILLAHTCFTTRCVLVIDDCEFVDDWSWQVLTMLLEVDNIFIVSTIATEKLTASPQTKKILNNRSIKHCVLQPIERLYLGALACQILEVYAISPELENVIQTRSNGNPGWVESYLTSSIQDKALNIVKATLSEIQKLGLVCPPLYMMARLNETAKQRWQLIMEERKLSESCAGVGDNWERYIDSCRDSYLNVTIREQMEGFSKEDKVPICVISETFSVSDNDVELSMDAMVLKTFDSLNYYEQLLVKCSATLGYQFYRQMLLYVMSATDKRKVAFAVKKLFEIKVLTCAKGDFLEEGTRVFKERLINPMDKFQITCDCRGLNIYGECMDLPKYASCGYLQFRSSLFRDITYNLLTDQQKKEFHHRAINYLERETHKCKACGGDFFIKILGTRHDKEFIQFRSKHKSKGSNFRWDSQSRNSSSDHTLSGVSTERSRTSHSSSMASSIAPTKPSIASVPVAIIPFDEKRRSSYESLHTFFGISMMKKLKDSFTLARAFSTEDFTDCQCGLILNTTYAQLIEHCKGAGQLHKLIEAMMEYAYTSILVSNIPLALRTLHEALDVLLRISIKNHETENLWKFTLIRAKIHILMGYSLLEMGHLDEAHEKLLAALKEYGIKFPTGLNRRMKISVYKLRQMFGIYIFPSTLFKNLEHWETIYSNNLSECLSHLCILYMARNEWRNADMAATWSLTKALESFSDFRVVCTACENMISVSQHFARWKMCNALEVYALKICHVKKHDVQAEDLRCVGKLYGVIFTSRVSQSQVEQAIQMGYIVFRLCTSIRVANIILPLLPHLLRALLMGKHFANANSLLKELHDLAEHYTDTSGKVWYFAECLNVQIETGYTVVHYTICQNIYNMEGEAWITSRDPDAGKRFFILMWLWCLRNDEWEEAWTWIEKVENFTDLKAKDSLSNKFSALYVLEGLLHYFIYKKDKYNVLAARDIKIQIDKLIKAIENVGKLHNILIPRLYHLKAYYRYITHNDAEVTDLLNKATKYAEKQKNWLEVDWIEHSKKAWNNELPAAEIDFWKDHSEMENIVDFQDIDTGEHIGFYTLSSPIYK